MDHNNLNPTIQLPPQLSTFAPEIDRIYYFIYWTSVVFFVGIVGAMLYFMVKYRRRAGSKAAPTGHHNTLELFWTFSPLILLFIMFHWGFQTYMQMARAPDDSINIQVNASRWNWEFVQPNGMTENTHLRIPVGRPVRLVMSSRDVLHSFFAPDFRVKHDLVPGMFTSVWFQAVNQPDANPNDEEIYSSQIFCTEYCGGPVGDSPYDGTGGGHSSMRGTVHVMTDAQYAAYLERGPSIPAGLTAAQWGDQIFTANCTQCHSREQGAPAGVGPNFYGMWGRQENLEDGSTITIDEAYVRESIRMPGAKIVRGYPPSMPPWSFPQSQMDALVAHLQTLHN